MLGDPCRLGDQGRAGGRCHGSPAIPARRPARQYQGGQWPGIYLRTLDHWAYFNRVTLDFSRPGKPTDNAFVESFNGRLRDECLTTHWFLSLDDARSKIEAWRTDFNEIRGHLEELYGIDVSPDLISTITDAVLETVAEWQGRPLDTCYPLVFFDAIRVKIRDEGFVRNKAVYIALGIQPYGTKEVLGIWIEQTEGAKFWLRVMNELKNRGITDILIAVVDGLKGFPEAINAVFPEAIVQTCIVHLIRNSMSFASWKDRKLIAQALRSVYRAETPEAGMAALEAFEEGHWGKKHPAIAQSWRRHWDQVIPFFAFPEGVRRIIYTTNAIEALNSKIRRAVGTRGHFPGDDAAMKLLYLVLNHAADEWKRPLREWGEAKSQFAVIFGERFVI